MEFGALQCVPKVQIVVFACLTIVVPPCKKESRPAAVKSKKLKVRNRYFNWLFLTRMKTP
jgi:hypothetical protein